MSDSMLQEVKGIPLGFPESFEEMIEVNLLYSSAVREVCVKLENLNQEFEMKHDRNPIQHISHRIKRPDSVRKKMLRRGLPLEYEVMRGHILDIGGVRVICSYISDIYDIEKFFAQQDDVLLIEEKDYIANPKSNGYRSFHLIVGIRVNLSQIDQIVPVEIQIRTMAMDYWASLEHHLRYKGAGNVPPSVQKRLTKLAEKIYQTDAEMQDIYHIVQDAAPANTLEE